MATYVSAFQEKSGKLWTISFRLDNVDRNLTMASGTSPSIAALPDHGWYVAAFHGANGNLWTLDPDLNAVDRGLTMAASSSPCITVLRDRLYAVAFHGANGNLWTMDPDLDAEDRGLGMAPGTSPSIALLRGGNMYAVAFHGADGNLWTMDPDRRFLNRAPGIREGTSPCLTPQPNESAHIAPSPPSLRELGTSETKIFLRIQGPPSSLVRRYFAAWVAVDNRNDSGGRNQLSPDTTQFEASGLTSGTRYRVNAWYDSYDGRFSGEATVETTTDGSPPPPARVLVPNLWGMSLKQASELLSAAQLRLGFVWNDTGSIDGKVLRVSHQDPAAGASVQVGSTVNARVILPAGSSTNPREASEWEPQPAPPPWEPGDPTPVTPVTILGRMRSALRSGPTGVEASGGDQVRAAWIAACPHGSRASYSCCAGGDRYPNNCAHFLSNAFILAGWNELLMYGARCPAGRPIRAREMWQWFMSKATYVTNAPTSNDPDWWAVFQLNEQEYWGGHVALYNSHTNEYLGTGWYKNWQQFYYTW